MEDSPPPRKKARKECAEVVAFIPDCTKAKFFEVLNRLGSWPYAKVGADADKKYTKREVREVARLEEEDLSAVEVMKRRIRGTPERVHRSGVEISLRRTGCCGISVAGQRSGRKYRLKKTRCDDCARLLGAIKNWEKRITSMAHTPPPAPPAPDLQAVFEQRVKRDILPLLRSGAPDHLVVQKFVEEFGLEHTKSIIHETQKRLRRAQRNAERAHERAQRNAETAKALAKEEPEEPVSRLRPRKKE